MSIRTIMVTGSSGTVGTPLCELLLEKEYDVVGVDKVENQWNKTIDDLTIKADLRDKKQLATLPTTVDLVIHLAANARVYNLVTDPALARDNFETTFNILEFVRQNRLPRLMFASSREVYGNSEKKVHQEDDLRLSDCESPYTASKIAGEALAWAYHRCYGTDIIIFRLSNVYGRYDNSDRVVPLFIRECSANREITIFGGSKMLDFAYIDDTINGIILATERFATAKNNVYNLASGKGVAIYELAAMIKNMLGSTSPITVGENRVGEVVRYVANIERAQRLLQFQPQYSIEEGLRRAIAWHRDNAAQG